MIRYVEIGNQLGYAEENKNEVEFAFYDTVTGKFLEFNQENVWLGFYGWQHDFIEEYEDGYDNGLYERLCNLIPDKLK